MKKITTTNQKRSIEKQEQEKKRGKRRNTTETERNREMMRSHKMCIPINVNLFYGMKKMEKNGYMQS